VGFDLDALKSLLRGRVLLFCHHNADPDAICAAFAMQRLIMTLDASVSAEIALPGGSSSLSKRVMEAMGIQAAEDFSLEGADALVFLDTATLNQLEDWGSTVASFGAPKIFIDHHATNPETLSIATIHIVDERASSTCEIVHRLYDRFNATPSPIVAKALLAGIAFDSKRFTVGTEATFESVSRLLEIDGPLEDVIGLLRPIKGRSERIAVLKASQRLKLHEVGGWIVATSHLSSFQASAARALLFLGADLAIVAGDDKNKLRASVRSTERFHRETSIHLGRDIAIPLGEEFEGAGSGHSTAAGINGAGAPGRLIQRALEILDSRLG
jgi:phosphoesterase RecJ-like protein